MKPLVRWTVGGLVGIESFECLRLSVRHFRSIYKERFELAVCYNSCDSKQIDLLNKLNVKLIDQRMHVSSLPIGPTSTAWKLYPPRLRPEAHEIFIDNDLLIRKPLPHFDQFLASDGFLVTQGLGRNYGRFYNEVPSCKLNTGIIGLPPQFDLKDALIQAFVLKGFSSWEGHFDEQGVIASIITSHKYTLVELEDIGICDINSSTCLFGKYGVHFVSLNSGNKSGWNMFLNNFLVI